MTNETCAICAEKFRDEQSVSTSRRLLSEKNTSMLQRMEWMFSKYNFNFCIMTAVVPDVFHFLLSLKFGDLLRIAFFTISNSLTPLLMKYSSLRLAI